MNQYGSCHLLLYLDTKRTAVFTEESVIVFIR